MDPCVGQKVWSAEVKLSFLGVRFWGNGRVFVSTAGACRMLGQCSTNGINVNNLGGNAQLFWGVAPCRRDRPTLPAQVEVKFQDIIDTGDGLFRHEQATKNEPTFERIQLDN